MSFITYKMVNGSKYAYEITSYWDKELQKTRKKNKYLGIPNDQGSFQKKRDCFTKGSQELAQLDFGDGFLLNEMYKKSAIYKILEEELCFKELPVLMFYRLAYQSAMYNAADWFCGSVTSVFCRDVHLSSQNISRILQALGAEAIQQKFFKAYLHNLNEGSSAVIIDATSLPNQINTDFNAWGYSDGSIDKQFRLLCVLNKDTKKPLFYRYLPGNISDVSTLQQTVLELGKIGVKTDFALIDAGYFSESNILDLYEKNIDFLTRLPASRCLYKDLIRTQIKNLETYKYACKVGIRGLFIKRVKVSLYGKKAYAFVVLDPLRKGKESNKRILEYCNDNKQIEPDNSCGIMILISSVEFNTYEVVENYYARQAVEQVFGFYKDDLGSLPLKCHTEDTVRGYLFLQFITLILFLEVRLKLQKEYTVEQALLITRNIKCKIFPNTLLVAELTKKQKQIFELCGIMVPKSLGI